jgi:hypothetical protein
LPTEADAWSSSLKTKTHFLPDMEVLQKNITPDGEELTQLAEILPQRQVCTAYLRPAICHPPITPRESIPGSADSV